MHYYACVLSGFEALDFRGKFILGVGEGREGEVPTSETCPTRYYRSGYMPLMVL